MCRKVFIIINLFRNIVVTEFEETSPDGTLIQTLYRFNRGC